MPQYTTLAGYVIAAVLALIGLSIWRKAMSLQVLLVESANRLAMLKQRGQQLEKELERTKEKLSSQRNISQKLEGSLKSKADLEQGTLEEIREELAEKTDELHQKDLKLDHFKQQVEVLTEQLRTAESAKKDAENKVLFAEGRAQEKALASKQQLSDEVKEWKKRHRAVEADLKSLRSELVALRKNAAQIDPKELNAMKSRLTQYKSLYGSMRGLREMAEERNRNWESALRQLAAWILRNSDSRLNPDQAPIGPVVGEALETIGAQLVHDEYARPGAKPQSRAPSTRTL